MDTQDIISLVIGILGIGGAVFTVFFKVTNPQIALEKENIKQEKDIESKSNLIDERMKWEKEENNKKFIDMTCRLDKAFELAQNHTHTVDVKVDVLIKTVGDMDSRFGKELVRLSTILEERLPKK